MGPTRCSRSKRPSTRSTATRGPQRNECTAPNKTRDEDQVMRYGEVLDNQTWTVTSMPIDNAEQPAETAIGA